MDTIQFSIRSNKNRTQEVLQSIREEFLDSWQETQGQRYQLEICIFNSNEHLLSMANSCRSSEFQVCSESSVETLLGDLQNLISLETDTQNGSFEFQIQITASEIAESISQMLVG